MNQNVKNEKINKSVEVFFCLFLCVIILTASLLIYYTKKEPGQVYRLTDTDCYMRLIRVKQLHETGQWYNQLIVRSNAPYGEVQHWTRPLDVLLLGGAHFFSFFTDFDSALFFWAVMISPIILALIAFFLRWAVLPLLSKDGPPLVILIIIFQPLVTTYCQAGRPDHHSLLIFLFVLSLGLVLRLIHKPFSVLLPLTAALVATIAIWVSVESLTWVLLTLAFLGGLWIWLGEDYSKRCLYYSASIAVFTALFILVEKGFYDFALVEYDSFSIVHLYLLVVISLLLIPSLTSHQFPKALQSRCGRLCYGFLAAAAVTLAIWMVFPDFFHGPLADMNETMKRLWLVKVNEVQPLFSVSTLAIPIEVTSTFAVTIVYVLYLIKTRTAKTERISWIYILIMLICFFTLSLCQLRWAVYAQVLIVVLLAELTAEALERVKISRIKIWRSIKRLLIIISVSTGFFVLAISVSIYTDDKQIHKSYSEMYLVDICQYLADISKDTDRPLRIVTHVDFGPEILYRTNCEVIATPYHRNIAGITDTYEIMTADTDEHARSLIDLRHADTILLCPKSTESNFYSKPNCSDTFYQRLKKDNYPNWLKKIELPEKLSQNFVLFKVTEQ